jgi:predicted small metal-binding protein
MTKMLLCKHLGVDCYFVARGKTEKELLKKAAEHAKKDHHIQKVTEEYHVAWRKAIRNE